ncbi:MAG: hypothetical protein LBD23_00640 [Oscillospiraceae bacterium]|jgi:hypothetical protein|nr:hypothetical protein [Oscillospiraceae bacterium]
MIMERLWLDEVRMKYPKQWIILVNIAYESENKSFGDVYLVTSDKKEAYTTAKSLGESMGEYTVIAGYDDTPQIGGFAVCSQ